MLYFCLFTFYFCLMTHWQTSRRQLSLDKPLVMAILNVTPDSFSDGGEVLSVDDALRRAETMISDGADIIDVGGESTRPGGKAVAVDDEIARTVPAIEAIAKRFCSPIAIDTSQYEVARQALDAGAEIVNDISGLRFDERLAELAAVSGAALVLMHSRGTFETMHTVSPVDDIFAEVASELSRSIGIAKAHGVTGAQIALDIGIGFGKTHAQNLELLAKLDNIVGEFKEYPFLVGASRKSFIGRILGDVPPMARLAGSLAAALTAVRNGAKIIRVHDVGATVQALKVTEAISARG
jgi:dihydropteroate synthase